MHIFCRLKSASLLFFLTLISAHAFADEERESKSWTLVPLVMSSPAIGNGVGVAGMFFLDIEGDEPHSFIGGGIGYSDTHSSFAGIGGKFYLNNDSWRLTAGIGRATIESNLNIPFARNAMFTTDADVLHLQSLWRVKTSIYAGLKLNLARIQYTAADAYSQVYLDLAGAEDGTTAHIGPVIHYDTRDSQWAPTSGVLIELEALLYPESWGNSADFSIYTALYNQYYELKEGNVVAWRFAWQGSSSDTPYFNSPTLGGTAGLRAFNYGEVHARNLFSAQAEWRFQLSEKWGGVVFAGAAALDQDEDIPAFLRARDHYYSGGVGIRYRLINKERLNLRFDYAVGNDNNDAFYVGIGESF